MEQSLSVVGNVGSPLQSEGIGGHMRRTVESFGFAFVGLILSTKDPLKTMFEPLEMGMHLIRSNFVRLKMMIGMIMMIMNM